VLADRAAVADRETGAGTLRRVAARPESGVAVSAGIAASLGVAVEAGDGITRGERVLARVAEVALALRGPIEGGDVVRVLQHLVGRCGLPARLLVIGFLGHRPSGETQERHRQRQLFQHRNSLLTSTIRKLQEIHCDPPYRLPSASSMLRGMRPFYFDHHPPPPGAP